MSLHDLDEWNAHFVIADAQKKPLRNAWLDNAAPLKTVLAHAQGDGYVGIVPGKSGLAVVDVDSRVVGGQIVKATEARPLRREHIEPLAGTTRPVAIIKTRRGYHLIYARPHDGLGNRGWEAYGLAGEVRCDAGYTVVWNPEMWAKVLEYARMNDNLDVAHPFPHEIFRQYDTRTAKSGERILAPGESGKSKTKANVTPEVAKAVLDKIDPDISYEGWYKVGAGLHDAFSGSRVGLDLWDAWSQRGDKYKDGTGEGTCGYHYASFTVGGGISWGTVLHMAGELVKSGERTLPPNRKSEKSKKPEKPQNPASALSPQKPEFAMDEAGLAAALEYIDCGYRFNVRARSGEFDLGRGRGWEPALLPVASAIRQELARRCEGKKWGKDNFFDVCDALFYNKPVDPVLEWIEALPAWDEIERLDYTLSDLYNIDRTPLTMWAARYLFVGVIQRAYDPGCKLDEFPVFIGAQGIGKSTFCKVVFPREQRQRWFTDQLDLQENPQRQVEAVQGTAVVELAELVGRSKLDKEAFKAFVSREEDGQGVRMAYARGTAPLPRRFVLVGTANPDRPLPSDPTGNRRLVAIELGAPDGATEEFIRPIREALWAEALYRYRGGLRANLPRELYPARDAAGDRHVPVDETIEEEIAGLEPCVMGLSLKEICKRCGLGGGGTPSRRDEWRVTPALRRRGWEDARIGNKRVWRTGALWQRKYGETEGRDEG